MQTKPLTELQAASKRLDAVQDAAWAEFEKVTAPAWAEYEKATAPAREACDQICGAASAEFTKVLKRLGG